MLATDILHARATVNELRAVQGPRDPMTRAAERELRYLQDQARRLFR